eukprot:5975741-Pyramimonas_sp.AAC.1
MSKGSRKTLPKAKASFLSEQRHLSDRRPRSVLSRLQTKDIDATECDYELSSCLIPEIMSKNQSVAPKIGLEKQTDMWLLDHPD